MARNFPNQQLDLVQILQEAQQRWLRPSEICEIIRNFHKFQLTPDPPVKPAAGSLFLFNRKALRYFRKDGHRWRKKKDGKTVREAHEKLKASSVDVLHCYYAHGEDDENFQRRSYWMLDGQLEHIVLVHYREVKEGYKSGISRVQNADPTESPQESSARFFTQGDSPVPTVQNSYGSSPNTVDFSGQTLSTEFDDGDSGHYPVATPSLTQPLFGYAGCNISLPGLVRTGPFEVTKSNLGSEFSGTSFDNCTESLLWGTMNSSSTNVLGGGDQKYHFEKPSGSELMTHMLIDLKPGASNALHAHYGDKVTSNVDKGGYNPNSERVFQGQPEQNFSLDQPQLQSSYHPQTIVASTDLVNNNYLRSNNVESVELKKLDSFGRWMDKEIGKDCDDSLMASDSGNYWNTLNEQNDDKEVSSLSRHMQLDIGSPSPSLAQEQLFSIKDFSPDWTNCGVEAKVLITGNFLGDAKSYNQYNWSCMFGEIEVSAEVLTENAIRCRAPLHASGCVPFYITCSNRLACSEVREFEYREDPSGFAFNMSVRSAPEEEMRFQISLTKLLSSSFERMWLDCSIQDCEKCKLKNKIYLMKSGHETDWTNIEKNSSVLGGNYNKVKDILIENLLKDKLCEWLVCKTHEGGKGPNILDEQGQGAIHLAAALGYDWAMAPIVAAGVSPSFRDSRGRTGLHWASYYGREATVIALVRLGAAPGALEDPTPAFPGGKTAADLASSRGYKGIAGYVAEADLVSHLSSMSINRNEIDSFTANIAADKATETAIQTAIPSDKEHCSLKGSLTAVRNSTRAAALIQSALRAISFRHRQSTKVVNDDISEDPHDLVALGSLSRVQKMGHFHDYLHSAAIKIQQKYRGWKGRKDFLKIRSRIVKLQAHVRGHQVRKQYKKVIWSVSIVEKAVLRWRRKRPGLRGFRVNLTTDKAVSEGEKSDDYDFLRIGRKQKFAGVEKALARVQSMVRHPEARDQYMRMVTKFENFKMGDEGGNGRHD